MSAGSLRIPASMTGGQSVIQDDAAAVVITTTSRLALLDAARMVAAIGIVWVHAAQSDAGKLLYPMGTFGVPFYTFIAVLFMARALTRDDRKTTLGHYVFSRLGRVYVPFLFWSLIYALLLAFKHFVAGQPIVIPHWSIIYTGGHEHLWFLPYLMVVTVIGAVLVRLLQNDSAARWLTVSVLVASGIFLCFIPEPAWIAQRAYDVETWRYAFRATPTVCWSLALALATSTGGRIPRSAPMLAVGGAILMALALGLQHFYGSIKALRSLAGLGLVLIALMPLCSPLWERIGRLGRYSFGIYLSHVVFLRVIVLWADRYGWAPSLTLDVISFVIAFAGASVLSVLLHKSKYTRWTVGE